MTWDAGSVYPATLAVTDATGAPVNPATATLTVTLPDQTTQSPAVTLPPVTTGLLLVNFASSANLPGLHKFTWATTGPAVTKTDYVSFRAYVSAVSLQDGRDRLGLKNTTRDEIVRLCLGAATRLAERVVGTLVPRVFTDDWIPGTYRDILRLPHGPALNSSSVTLVKSVYPFGPSWDATELVVNPHPGTVRLGGLIPFWYGPWTATYTAGVQEIAEPVAEAVKEIMADLFAPYRGLSAEQAAALSEGLIVPPYFKLPARALEMLKPYEMPGFG